MPVLWTLQKLISDKCCHDKNRAGYQSFPNSSTTCTSVPTIKLLQYKTLCTLFMDIYGPIVRLFRYRKICRTSYAAIVQLLRFLLELFLKKSGVVLGTLLMISVNIPSKISPGISFGIYFRILY